MEVTLSTKESVKRSRSSYYTPRDKDNKHNEGTALCVGPRIPTPVDVAAEPKYYYPTRVKLVDGRFTQLANRRLCLSLEIASPQVVELRIRLYINSCGDVSPTNAVVVRDSSDNTNTSVGVHHHHRMNGHLGNYNVSIGKLDASDGYTNIEYPLTEVIGPWWVDLVFYTD